MEITNLREFLSEHGDRLAKDDWYTGTVRDLVTQDIEAIECNYEEVFDPDSQLNIKIIDSELFLLSKDSRCSMLIYLQEEI
jgi:hypothetical protein